MVTQKQILKKTVATILCMITIMNSLYKRFMHSVAWNAFESIVYHAILLTHQIALFKCISYQAYGFIGSLFALIYLSVTLINLGLDASLAPFFSQFSKNKQTFYHLFRSHIFISYIFYALILLIFFVAKYFISSKATLFIHNNIPLLIIIAMLIATESIKKTTKTLLQLAFQFPVAVFGEIGSIVFFVALVWGNVAWGTTLNAILIFSAMLIVSIIETLVFCFYLHRWYLGLPEHQTQVIQLNITKNRFFNFCNQVSKLLISGNLLVPFFAITFGLEYAGVLKLASNITHSITTVLEKTFGTSSSVLLAQTKHLDVSIKQKLFHFITNRTNQVLYCFLIFCLINVHQLLNTTQGSFLPILYLYFLIHFCDSFFITYEKFYLMEERADYLLVLSCLNLLSVLFVLWYTYSPLHTLACMLVIRLLSYVLISIFSFVTWNLKPTLQLSPRYFFGSLIVSLIFFLITS